jgi:hypothetical protein
MNKHKFIITINEKKRNYVTLGIEVPLSALSSLSSPDYYKILDANSKVMQLALQNIQCYQICSFFVNSCDFK